MITLYILIVNMKRWMGFAEGNQDFYHKCVKRKATFVFLDASSGSSGHSKASVQYCTVDSCTVKQYRALQCTVLTVPM